MLGNHELNLVREARKEGNGWYFDDMPVVNWFLKGGYIMAVASSVMSLFLGGLALLLTSIGLYGLETQRVTQRTAEIGLRMALGAQRRDVLWSILREAGMFFVVGVPIGLALTAITSRFIGSLLYEIAPLDPRIHGGTVLAMLAVGFLAAYLPARRATRVDPMVALRYE